MSSPAAKRIMQEIREIEKEGGGEVTAEAMEDDIFEWYFAIRGPRDSDFEGGIYVGRLTLPPDYPLAPPSFTMLTRSGRFETGARICLSISSFHADLWSPSWSVRSALLALAAFMPTPGGGAMGAIEGWPSEDVKAAAAASRAAVPRVSSSGGGGGGGGGAAAAARRQAVVDRLHARLLGFGKEGEKGKVAEVGEAAPGSSAEAAAAAPALAPASPSPAAEVEAGSGLRQRQQQPAAEAATTAAAAEAATTAAAAAAPALARQQQPPLARTSPLSAPNPSASSSWEDALLTALAGALLFAIAGILARKMLLRLL